MKGVETIADLRTRCDDARRRGATVGLVPTMGFFHAGHRSLMELARAETDLVVVSSFVNPTQFAAGEDLDAYPRDTERDDAIARAVGVDVMFSPAVTEMYPDGSPTTTVHVAQLTDGMCGAARPGHFDGVTTVVAKLFSIVGPCRAYFGRKDFQQLAVVRRMVRDLDLPVVVVGAPLVRESDGLALSSRNAYLTAPERSAAPALHRALLAAVTRLDAGTRDAASLVDVVRRAVAEEPVLALEYVEVRRSSDLASISELEGEFVIAVAAQVGRARLIDNVVVVIDSSGAVADLGVRVADGPSTAGTS